MKFCAFAEIKKNCEHSTERPRANLYRIDFPLALCDNRSVALWGANAEAFGPERWAAGADGAAAVRGNYGFLAFLVGFRYVYARVSISVRDWRVRVWAGREEGGGC